MHKATRGFWECFDRLPENIQQKARKKYELLKQDSNHRSLHFKEVGKLRSVRIDLNYRALGIPIEDGVEWFWIGDHDEYERVIKSMR